MRFLENTSSGCTFLEHTSSRNLHFGRIERLPENVQISQLPIRATFKSVIVNMGPQNRSSGLNCFMSARDPIV